MPERWRSRNAAPAHDSYGSAPGRSTHGSVTPLLRLSQTICRATPPKLVNAPTWQAIQSGSACAPACLGIREIGGAERCHADLCPPHLASGAVDDLNGLPGVVDEQPLARRMGLAHRRRQAAAPGGI